MKSISPKTQKNSNNNSSQKNSQNKKKEFPIYQLNINPKLIISKKIQHQIAWLHNKVGGKEWSGLLFYKVDGSITDLDNIQFTATDIFLKDIGTSGFTGYEFNEDIIDAYDTIDEADNKKIGHIHTHYSMGAYFSNVDMSELHTNAPNHNYYLSLVVDFQQKYQGKLCMVGNIQQPDKTIVVPGEDGEMTEVTIPSNDRQQNLIIADCDIEYEQDQWFIDRYNKVLEEKEKQSSSNNKQNPNVNPCSQIETYNDFYKINSGYIPRSSKDSSVYHNYNDASYKFLIDILTVDESNKNLDEALEECETMAESIGWDHSHMYYWKEYIVDNFHLLCEYYMGSDDLYIQEQALMSFIDILDDYDKMKVSGVLKETFEEIIKDNNKYLQATQFERSLKENDEY